MVIAAERNDYHYHIAPTHLQEIVGKDKPVAYALDGYAIYGFTEPDGTKVEGLDQFNGHTTPELGYHYHATKTYPYLNGGFHGEVVERDGQVDPQPRAGGVREKRFRPFEEPRSLALNPRTTRTLVSRLRSAKRLVT